MSHPLNDEFLERAKEDFEEAENREEREAVVQRVREEGFTQQADFLARYVEEGVIPD